MTPEERAQILKVAEELGRKLPGFVERVEKECPDLLEKAGADIKQAGRVLGTLFGFTPKP